MKSKGCAKELPVILWENKVGELEGRNGKYPMGHFYPGKTKSDLTTKGTKNFKTLF
jgi:hypothetical protein